MPSALEEELSRRTRQLLAQGELDSSGSVTIRLNTVSASLSYSKDGDNEFLTVWVNGEWAYAEHDGRNFHGGIHHSDKVYAAVVELRKHMILDDIASGTSVPVSILEPPSDV